MKPQHLTLLLCGLLLALTTFAAAQQQPAKPKRPVKNPPQFPNIIDVDGKAPPATVKERYSPVWGLSFRIPYG